MMFSWWFLQYPQRATFFFFNDTATTEIYTLSLHDALPICGARHRDVGDALQPAPARVHDGRQRSRQYSAQSGGVPFLAPAKPRRDVAVGVTVAGLIRDRPQVGPVAGRPERFLHGGGTGSARRVEVGLDQRALVPDDLPARGAQGIPHLRRLSGHAGVHLIADVGPGVEPLPLPTSPGPEREGARHHRLGRRPRSG